MNSAKLPHVYKFSAKKFGFSLNNADAFFNEKKDGVDNKLQTSFNKFLNCLDSYLDLIDDSITNIVGETQINIYVSVTLENDTIMRATSSYHGRAWFSDITISMDSEESNDYVLDQGLCYRQVIIH